MSEIYPTSIPGCQLRFATEEDLPAIMNFIKELAEYVELLDTVEISEQEMRKNLFGPKPYAEVILAIYNKEPVGFALFSTVSRLSLVNRVSILKIFLCCRHSGAKG